MPLPAAGSTSWSGLPVALQLPPATTTHRSMALALLVGHATYVVSVFGSAAVTGRPLPVPSGIVFGTDPVAGVGTVAIASCSAAFTMCLGSRCDRGYNAVVVSRGGRIEDAVVEQRPVCDACLAADALEIGQLCWAGPRRGSTHCPGNP